MLKIQMCLSVQQSVEQTTHMIVREKNYLTKNCVKDLVEM